MMIWAYNLDRQTDRQTDRQPDRQTSITAPFLRVKLNIINISHLNG